MPGALSIDRPGPRGYPAACAQGPARFDLAYGGEKEVGDVNLCFRGSNGGLAEQCRGVRCQA